MIEASGRRDGSVGRDRSEHDLRLFARDSRYIAFVRAVQRDVVIAMHPEVIVIDAAVVHNVSSSKFPVDDLSSSAI